MVVDGQIVAEAPGPPLVGGVVLAQSFPVVVDGLAALDVHLANYARTADGTLEARLHDAHGRDVARWRLAGARVVDNAWHRFRLAAPLDLPAGTLLTLVLRRGGGGRPVTAWTTAGDVYPPGALAIDGRATGGDLAFRAVYRPGWRSGARHVLGTLPYPPAATAGLLWGLFASALALAGLVLAPAPAADAADAGPRGDR